MPDRHEQFTRDAWQEQWRSAAPGYSYDPASNAMLADAVALLRRHAPVGSRRFLEAGCGPAATALAFAQAGWEVAGVDLSQNAIDAARSEFASRSLKIDLRLGDVRALPFESATFDLVYAGGVVEHFRDTGGALREFLRCLRKGGAAVVTVPAFTLSWPYLFLRGNVPAVPGLEQVASFAQFRLLRGRLAAYGYERSFSRRRLRAMMAQAGFARVEISRFDTFLPLPQLPSALRPLARRIATSDLFCPMWCAVGVKG